MDRRNGNDKKLLIGILNMAAIADIRKMNLDLRGPIMDTLDHAQILEDLHSGMNYYEVAKKHGVSHGTIFRIADHYDALKYKKKSLKHMTNVKRHGWACQRPMAKYKGAYPGGFLKRLDKLLGITKEHAVLHLFSGSIQGRENEHTMDIQSDHNPTFVADAREEFPMDDETYNFTLVDPPYDLVEESKMKIVKIHYSNPLWETEPVRPYAWVNEAVRVTKTGGFLCILHHLVYKTPKHCRRALTVSVTCGPNTRIRVLNIFQKIPKEMWETTNILTQAIDDQIIGETEHEPRNP